MTPLHPSTSFSGPQGPVVLLIMDGIGIGRHPEGDVVRQANTPILNWMAAHCLTTRLKAHGNTIVVIEHNLDVIKTADWIIDLGPEGGSGGGTILVSGTPEQVAEHPSSHTARFLKPLLTS